jgi:exonuclease VII small subunit
VGETQDALCSVNYSSVRRNTEVKTIVQNLARYDTMFTYYLIGAEMAFWDGFSTVEAAKDIGVALASMFGGGYIAFRRLKKDKQGDTVVDASSDATKKLLQSLTDQRTDAMHRADLERDRANTATTMLQDALVRSAKLEASVEHLTAVVDRLESGMLRLQSTNDDLIAFNRGLLASNETLSSQVRDLMATVKSQG